MKKLQKLGFVLFLILITFSGCKKGENDPFLSLLSRKARLTGEWKLTTADYEYKEVTADGTSTTSYSFDGTSMTETTDGNGKTYPYSEIIEISKDGTFKTVVTEEVTYQQNQTQLTGTRTVTVEGVWYFLDGIKDTDIKDKERVEFFIQKYTEVNPNNGTEVIELSGSIPWTMMKGFSGVNIILLDRLANKEITTLYDSELTSDGETYTLSGSKDYIRE